MITAELTKDEIEKHHSERLLKMVLSDDVAGLKDWAAINGFQYSIEPGVGNIMRRPGNNNKAADMGIAHGTKVYVLLYL